MDLSNLSFVEFEYLFRNPTNIGDKMQDSSQPFD